MRDSYNLPGDDFNKLEFVQDTSLCDSLCGVQLDALALKRWELAYDAVRGSFAAVAIDEMPLILETVVVDKSLSNRPNQTNKAAGFDTQWASWDVA